MRRMKMADGKRRGKGKEKAVCDFRPVSLHSYLEAKQRKKTDRHKKSGNKINEVRKADKKTEHYNKI